MSRPKWREKGKQMSTTPGGSWLKRHLDLDISTGPTGYCPNCHSSEWKSASFVYQESRSVTSSRTKGTSISVAPVGVRNGAILPLRDLKTYRFKLTQDAKEAA